MYVHCALAYQAIHPCEVGKLVPAIGRDNNAMAMVGVQMVAACTGKSAIVSLVTEIKPTALIAHHH